MEGGDDAVSDGVSRVIGTRLTCGMNIFRSGACVCVLIRLSYDEKNINRHVNDE